MNIADKMIADLSKSWLLGTLTCDQRADLQALMLDAVGLPNKEVSGFLVWTTEFVKDHKSRWAAGEHKNGMGIKLGILTHARCMFVTLFGDQVEAQSSALPIPYADRDNIFISASTFSDGFTRNTFINPTYESATVTLSVLAEYGDQIDGN